MAPVVLETMVLGNRVNEQPGVMVVKGLANYQLWVILINKFDSKELNPLTAAEVRLVMAQYSSNRFKSVAELVAAAGIGDMRLKKEELLSLVAPDYRQSANPTKQAIEDIYHMCRFGAIEHEARPAGKNSDAAIETFRIAPIGRQNAEVSEILFERNVLPVKRGLERAGIAVVMYSEAELA